VLAFTRTAAGPCIANMHASTGAANRRRAEQELRVAAERSLEWADGAPLILGGDLNVRPRDSGIYEELAGRFGLAAPTSPDLLDHLLVNGLVPVEAPSPWPDERREIPWGERRIRLSDHAPVAAAFAPAV
jgi:exonuclease III